MSFETFKSGLNKKFQELSVKTQELSAKTQELTGNLPTLAQSTQRLVQERLGQVTDISQLPQEYVELETRVDALRVVYEGFLKVTAVYENESYDYPAHIRDSVDEFSKSVAGVVSGWTSGRGNDEGASKEAPTFTSNDRPRTLAYALSKASYSASQNAPPEPQLADALQAYGDAQARIARERLTQDVRIRDRFNARLREALDQDLARAQRARREVHKCRLQYDVARTNLQQARPEKEASLRVNMEALEDQFAQATEDATVILQEVLARATFLGDIRELAQAQLEYHDRSATILRQFLDGSESSDGPAQGDIGGKADTSKNKSTGKIAASQTSAEPIQMENLSDDLDDLENL